MTVSNPPISPTTIQAGGGALGPRITGAFNVGNTLTASPGPWLDPSYQWTRDGAAISGATGATYVLTSADLGHTVDYYVTGTKMAAVGQVVGALVSSAKFPLFSLALAAAKAGTSNARIVHIGDSTTAGDWGGTTANGWANDARGGSVPTQLQAKFTAAIDPSFVAKSIFGNGGGVSLQSPSTLYDYDHELTVGSDWTPIYSAGTQCPGGAMLKAAANTSTTFGYTDTVLDRAEVYYPTNTTLDSAISVTMAGTQVGPINQQTAFGWGKSTYSGNPGSVLISQGANTSGGAYIAGMVAYSSAHKGVICQNMGAGGWATTDWIKTNVSSTFGPLDMIPKMSGNLYIICLGINDWQASLGSAAFQTNIATLIAKCQANGDGDVLVLGTNRTDPALGYDQPTQEAYVAAAQAAATAAGVKFFDIASITGFVNYATANAAGYMGDQRHPNRTGYGVIATALYNYLIT